MRNLIINTISWVLNNVFEPILKRCGYSFTYQIKLTDFGWIKPFIKPKS